MTSSCNICTKMGFI